MSISTEVAFELGALAILALADGFISKWRNLRMVVFCFATKGPMIGVLCLVLAATANYAFVGR